MLYEAGNVEAPDLLNTQNNSSSDVDVRRAMTVFHQNTSYTARGTLPSFEKNNTTAL